MFVKKLPLGKWKVPGSDGVAPADVWSYHNQKRQKDLNQTIFTEDLCLALWELFFWVWVRLSWKRLALHLRQRVATVNTNILASQFHCAIDKVFLKCFCQKKKKRRIVAKSSLLRCGQTTCQVAIQYWAVWPDLCSAWTKSLFSKETSLRNINDCQFQNRLWITEITFNGFLKQITVHIVRCVMP